MYDLYDILISALLRKHCLIKVNRDHVLSQLNHRFNAYVSPLA